MNIPAKTPQSPPPQTIEDVITKGDLSKLNSEQRTEFYIKLCNKHGLDPLTQPFDWLTLNNRLTLYANRRCTDQLRKINKISITIVSQEYTDGLLSIHVKAKDKHERDDEDLGVVSMPETLKGDARANQILKCVTKAKRRVTLSISGLGYLDETEIEDIPASAKAPAIPPARQIEPPNPTAAALVDMAEKQPTPSQVVEAVAAEGPSKGEMSGQAWRRFGEKMVAAARAGEAFTPEQQAQMSLMKKERPKMWQTMADAIANAQMTKPPEEPAGQPQPNPGDDPDAYRVWLIDQMSKIDKKKDLTDFFDIQRPLWGPCFPPDIDDWESLFKERIGELS